MGGNRKVLSCRLIKYYHCSSIVGILLYFVYKRRLSANLINALFSSTVSIYLILKLFSTWKCQTTTMPRSLSNPITKLAMFTVCYQKLYVYLYCAIIFMISLSAAMIKSRISEILFSVYSSGFVKYYRTKSGGGGNTWVTLLIAMKKM